MSKRINKTLKILDFIIGVPLLFFLGIFKIKRKIIRDIQKIGVLKTAALGDTTLLSGIIHDLKQSFPKARICLFSGPDNALLAPHIPFLDEVLTLPMKNPLKAIKIMRKTPVDILLDFGAWPRINALLTCFSKSKFKIGFKTPSQYRHYIYDLYINHDNSKHEIDNYRNLLNPLGVSSQSLPKLIFSKNNQNPFSKQKYCIFHLCGSGSYPELKEWPLSYWNKLYSYLAKKEYLILLTGSNADFHKNAKLEKMCANPLKIQNIAGKFSFDESLSIIASADLVVSINTGIMHVAAALGVATIGLNGSVNEKRWGVIGPKTYNISTREKGCQFLNLGFEYKNNRKDCMRFVDPSEVVKIIETIL